MPDVLAFALFVLSINLTLSSGYVTFSLGSYYTIGLTNSISASIIISRSGSLLMGFVIYREFCSITVICIILYKPV